MRRRLRQFWTHFWMQRAGLSPLGRVATRLGALFAAPYKARVGLAHRYPQGYISPSATIHRQELRLGRHIFIGDRVVIYQKQGAGAVELGDRVELHNDVIIEVGKGGSLSIGANTGIQPRCQFSAYLGAIQIGAGVQIAPNCAFYPYDHGTAPGTPISEQPLRSKGPIVVEDDAWLGFGVIVLSGVRIGKGAVIGAGSVVTRDIPAGAIAAGTPARVVKMRDELVIA